MKTACFSSLFGQLFASVVLLLLQITSALAAVVPLSVPPGGISLTFDNRAANSNGWSTLSIPSASTNIITADDLNAAVQNVDACSITNELGITAATLPPNANALAQWNSSGRYVQTRPTGNAATLLMLTLRNSWGSDLSSIMLQYDFGALVINGAGIDETLPGHRIYFSLTGESNTWVNIAQLSNTTSFALCVSFLPDAWEVGANLYLLWADDNGPSGSSGTLQEGTYTIDNLQIGQAAMGIIIVQQPHNVTVEQGRTTNLTVSCAANVRYQWFKGQLPITNATNCSLQFPSAQPQDSGTYFVSVDSDMPFWCGGPSSIQSMHVTVTVTPDTTPPVVLRALGKLGDTNIVVTFSERIAESSVTDFSFQLTASGELIDLLETRMISDSEVALVTATPLALANYDLSIDPSVSDPQGNAIADGSAPLSIEVPLLTIQNASWSYNHEGVDLGTAWRMNGYDDASWSNGLSVFDAYAPGSRTSVGGYDVFTVLPLHFGSYSVDALPVYYFRTHFHLPTIPEQVATLRLRTLVDDFDVVWLNGYEPPVHVHPAYTNGSVDVYGYGGGSPTGTPFVLPVNGFSEINPTNLVFGENLVAAKLFQASPGSLDATFAYELSAIVTRFMVPDSHLRIVRDSADLQHWVVRWDTSTGRLHESSDVAAPFRAWTPVAGAENGNYVVPAGAVSKFYTIRP